MNTIIPWLEHLNVLMSPGHIALVGAGNGKGAWAQWLLHQAGKSRVTLLEAEPLQYATLQRTLNSLGERAQHYEIRNTLVAAQQGTTSFFVASSQQESGLLEPQSLLSLWPNLQTEEVRELSAITLDTLLGDQDQDAEKSMGEGHWLLIDCLPAGELLCASSKLDLVDVVIARVLLGERHAVPAGASLEDVAELLLQKGMAQVAFEATRHPGIGYALFVRDAKSALHAQVQKHHSESQKLYLKSEKQTKWLEESRAKAEQLAQAKLVVEQQSQERQAQIEQLTQVKAAAEKQLQERAQQLEQLGKGRDEQATLAQERQARIEQLTQAKAAAEKQSQERAQQLEQLGKARDEQTKLAQERQARIEQLIQEKLASEKMAAEYRKKNEAIALSQSKSAKRGTDDDIDDFIKDVAPYFKGHSITYVDVGAYVGEVFLKIINSNQILVREAHLFEPNPDSYSKLKKSIEEIKIKNLNTYNFSLGKEGEDLIFLKSDSMSRITNEDLSLESNKFYSKSRSLDSLAELFMDRHVDLLKIDVEGAEINVLENASWLLGNQQVDIVYIEVGLNANGTQQTYFGKVDVLMQKYGYRVFGIYEKTTDWTLNSPVIRRCNFAYMSNLMSRGNPVSMLKKIRTLEENLKNISSK